MSTQSLSFTEKARIVSSNTSSLNRLLNVWDEQAFLLQFMSPDAVKECIEAGATNEERIEAFVRLLVHELTNDISRTFDCLCEYFFTRSEAYRLMYQRFTVGDANSEMLLLREKVKTLIEELQYMRQSNQSELIAIKRYLIDLKLTSDDSLQSRHESAPCQNLLPTAGQINQFRLLGMPPLCQTSKGCYGPVDWNTLGSDYDHRGKWRSMCTGGSGMIYLPALLLASDIANDAAIQLCARRKGNDLCFYASLHCNSQSELAPVSVHFELRLVIDTISGPHLTLEKKSEGTIKGDSDWSNPLITFPSFPWPEMSPDVAPRATFIKITSAN